jgi:hypothetical protein
VRLLWGFSHGWWQYKDYVIGHKGEVLGVNTLNFGNYDVWNVKKEWSSCDDSVIYNAWALNFAGIATCAFALAEELKAEEKRTAPAAPVKKEYRIITSFRREDLGIGSIVDRLDLIDRSNDAVKNQIDDMKRRGASPEAIAKLEAFLAKAEVNTQIEKTVQDKIVAQDKTKSKDKTTKVVLGAIGSVALFFAGAPALAVAAPVLIGFYLASRVKTA